ncbi:MAG: hypothetical protein C4532_17875 [Candidatus Abyssobacteria bacterium SURF_17]|jgi:tetratricopeptide (TPR) repeat protein|uniref:Tetratricopeptide repeat protein n=1 Tax=Candidatus Abyssobacteria bacterium SURF_17 TaxID=2093361 RepID=A0A419EPW8_9BACT|nr:MAG: hypothetical protein C4532_17875 [Candidatus Abyssubacteria bacterium SURF_17]
MSTFLIGNLLFVTLLVLTGVSIYLAYSGYIPGRTHLGWAYFGFVLTVYFAFAYLCFRSIHDPFALFGSVLLMSLLLATQGPFVLELISQSIMPDPSKGLKLIKVYTEAERKAAQDDLPGAIAEYEKVIAEDPDDMTARFRLAELCYENEEYRKAAMSYEAILTRASRLDVHQHCSALTRLSEIYATHLNDIKGARKHVKTIIEKYPGTKYAGYAMERLDKLEEA